MPGSRFAVFRAFTSLIAGHIVGLLGDFLDELGADALEWVFKIDFLDKVGQDGVVTVEDNNRFGLDLEFTEGMRFDKGYISPYFVTNVERS